ncbi:hypothetical protein [Sphingobium sp.]|uniref:hypothetical protein n=1 Tax=Sphingobium sp. TaxID=1912891 RepID=UPI003B3A5089
MSLSRTGHRITTLPALRNRTCPCCGATDGKREIASPGDVEGMTLEQLRPYWHGLEKEKHFFPYRRCQRCALLYNPAFFDGAQLADLYSSMPPNMDMVPFAPWRIRSADISPPLRATARWLAAIWKLGRTSAMW